MLDEKERSKYRQLTQQEIIKLQGQGNTAENWQTILVRDPFRTSSISNCIFAGAVYIGTMCKQELSHHGLCLPVGLSHSRISDCILGDNLALHNVHYLQKYTIGDECILFNIQEMATTHAAKFGNGILKTGEVENTRIWLEICNENGGRRVLAFNGMLTSDAWLWSKYRGDHEFLEKIFTLTIKEFAVADDQYGCVGAKCIIKNSISIKDCNIGASAYIKGANKLKNLTINSSADAHTQIGEGVELVNGIIGYGCRIFYGVKAVRFVLCTNSSLKYGARLLNSILGENSTVSCCEVLNSLIFPSHEQHHNNSFLIAASIQGQSNIAAGATLGSNHTSRANDGELIAKRGFWAGLATSIKHNSRFASFTLLAKSNFKYSLDITWPFCLVANDAHHNCLEIIPAYWWRYNQYALARNAWKFQKRDSRVIRGQEFEYHFLAPDTVCEILRAYTELKSLLALPEGSHAQEPHCQIISHHHHAHSTLVGQSIITQSPFEASNRHVHIKKPSLALKAYEEMLRYFAITTILDYALTTNTNISSICELDFSKASFAWLNMGGQIVRASFVESIITGIKQASINSWSTIHAGYANEGQEYRLQKTLLALAILYKLDNQTPNQNYLAEQANLVRTIAQDFYTGIYNSRKKDYATGTRSIVYDSPEEMQAVLGSLDDNDFIQYARAATEQLCAQLTASFNLPPHLL